MSRWCYDDLVNLPPDVISDKLWERLEAARQRAIANSDVAVVPPMLELHPAAVQTSKGLAPAEHASSTAERQKERSRGPR